MPSLRRSMTGYSPSDTRPGSAEGSYGNRTPPPLYSWLDVGQVGVDASNLTNCSVELPEQDRGKGDQAGVEWKYAHQG